MATTILGKVSVTPKGAWSASTAYEPLDIVSNGGGSYISKQAVPAGTALTNTEYWLKITDKGDIGVSIASVTLNADYTLTITFTDGTSTTTTSIRGERGEKGDKGDSGNPEGNILQTTGQSTEDTMSQKAITDNLDSKADKNGYYTDMTVGNAEQLIATVGNTDNAPYLFRTSGGSADIGNRVREDWIEGGTIVRNQMLNKQNFESTKTSEGITFTNNGDGSVTLNGESTNESRYLLSKNVYIGFIRNHRYLITGGRYNGGESTVRIWFGSGSAFPAGHRLFDTGNGGSIVQALDDERMGNTQIYIQVVSAGLTLTNLKITPQLFDLTLVFGSTIADYLATLPIADALNLIKPWIDTNKYYASNTGSLESVNLLKKVSTGFNQFNKENVSVGYLNADGTVDSSQTTYYTSDFIPVIPNTQYYISATNSSRSKFYDANKNALTSEWDFGKNGNAGTFTTSSKTYFVRFSMQNNVTDTTVLNLSWSGAHNGEYKAYETHEYAMPSGELRGIPKLVNNKIVYDGDRYYPDGHKDARYIKVVLDGSQAILASNFTTGWIQYNSAVLGGAAKENSGIISSYYSNAQGTNNYITVYWESYGRIYIKDERFGTTINSNAEWNSWLSSHPISIIYELATPTTSEGTPYQQTQIVDDWGTERFVTVEGNEMPVGHNSFYQANLRDKIQHLPNLANTNGTYAIQQNGSQMYLVPIPNAIPTPPASGTHALKAVNGTLTWVEEV